MSCNISAAYFLKSSRSTSSKAVMFVALSITLPFQVSIIIFSSNTQPMPYFGTTLSSRPLPARNASFQRPTQRHHLQPPVSPTDRKSLPLVAEKSKNSSVTIAVIPIVSELALEGASALAEEWSHPYQQRCGSQNHWEGHDNIRRVENRS